MAVSAVRPDWPFVTSVGVPSDTVARRLKIALAEQDLPDQEIARLANVSAAWLGAVKQGHIKNPPIDKLRTVAAMLGKTTSYFTVPMGFIPPEEVENGLLVSVNEEDRELLGRIASRLAILEQAAKARAPDPPPITEVPRRPQRVARS